MSIRKSAQGILISSEERPMQLVQFDFEKVLWAMDEKPIADAIEDSFVRRKPIPASPHRKAMRLSEDTCLWGYASGTFFYSRSDRTDASQNMEIDFLIVEGYENAGLKPRVSPLEVKSSKRFSTSSLDKLKRKFNKQIGNQHIACPKELSVEGDRIVLPLYGWLPQVNISRNGIRRAIVSRTCK